MYKNYKISNVFIKEHEQHPFHLVDPSPWPLCTSISALTLTIGSVGWFHGFSVGFYTMLLGLFILVAFSFIWFKDIITESWYQGHHTRKVVTGLKMGVLLFIVSEIMFFFSFFWAFFHFSLLPSIWTGGVWPPRGIIVVSPCLLPTVNTFLLLSSGVTLTWAHAALIQGDRRAVIKGMALTLFFGLLFTFLQYCEYKFSSLHINDSVYASTFYLITGFHGFHVIIGSIFIFVCFTRVINPKKVTFTRQHHFGFVAALWYWHFVDVVWIFVFFIIYIWGGWGSWELLNFTGENSLGWEMLISICPFLN